MREPAAGVLICGTSHTGKSTLAARIGQATGAEVISTDALARHPGRPWPEVRPQVAEYYTALSDATIHWFLQVHHENMQAHVHRAIAAARNRHKMVVVEGAALRPELYKGLIGSGFLGVCLYADPELLRSRILEASDHALRDAGHRKLIDVFLERSLRENAALQSAAVANGFICVDVSDPAQADRLATQLSQALLAAQ